MSELIPPVSVKSALAKGTVCVAGEEMLLLKCTTVPSRTKSVRSVAAVVITTLVTLYVPLSYVAVVASVPERADPLLKTCRWLPEASSSITPTEVSVSPGPTVML